MNSIHACPRCRSIIAPERQKLSPVICDSCGFVASGHEVQAKVQLEKRFLHWTIAMSVLVIAGFIQLVQWGGYSLEVIPMQVRQWVHMNSPAHLERLAQISFELNKFDVTESALADLARLNSADYLRLGKLQMSRGRYLEASNSFRLYFAAHNEDLEAHYLFARALSETNHIDDASKHYEDVLQARPGMRQITVLQSYVKALTLAGRFAEARRVIESERMRDHTATLFMETEYKLILARLNGVRST